MDNESAPKDVSVVCTENGCFRTGTQVFDRRDGVFAPVPGYRLSERKHHFTFLRYIWWCLGSMDYGSSFLSAACPVCILTKGDLLVCIPILKFVGNLLLLQLLFKKLWKFSCLSNYYISQKMEIGS